MAQLSGRVAWVTGSSRGLGRAIADYLVRERRAVERHAGAQPDKVDEFAHLWP